MPQLDIATFAPQLVWLAIAFVVLYLLMAKWGLPQVAAALDARRSRVDGDLARAGQAKAEAEAVLAAYERAMATARNEAQSTIKATSDRLAAEAAERHRQLAATLAEQITAAEARIVASKNEALAEIRGIAIDVGAAVVEKLTGAAPGSGKVAMAVDGVLRERAH